MANIELLAVNAVSDQIAKCPHLEAEIASNDKTPITDGHVDVHDGTPHSKATLRGRVSVQVKGRSTNSKKQTPSFSIDRDTLEFFRVDGGGVYFFVQVRSDLSRVVFFVNLNPFRVNRMLKRDAKRPSFPVTFQRLPETPEEIEKIFQLALEQQKQGKAEGVDEHLLAKLRGITIHTLGEIRSDRPTVLDLAETDFAVTIETEGGLKIPFDMDITVMPSSYVPQEIDTTVRSGTIEYSRPKMWQGDNDLLNIWLSDGLQIRARSTAGELKANIDLTLQGSLRGQLRDLDFFLAAVHGEPLVIGNATHQAGKHEFAHEQELTTLRDRIARIVELFDAVGADENMVGSIDWSEDDKRTLLTLHRAIVLDEEVPATSDGYGRLDITVGPFKVVTLVTAGTAPGKLRLSNPFDPGKRARFRLFHTTEEGLMEEMTNGTVYESLQAPELPTILNLGVEAMVQAYDELEDRRVAYAVANQMVLTLLTAADTVTGSGRTRLLYAAEALSAWLVSNGDDALLYKINSWQTKYRLGTLSEDDKVEIRKERRLASRQDERDARVREACLSILLEDSEEVALVLQSITEEQAEGLRSWPIWALANAH